MPDHRQPSFIIQTAPSAFTPPLPLASPPILVLTLHQINQPLNIAFRLAQLGLVRRMRQHLGDLEIDPGIPRITD